MDAAIVDRIEFLRKLCGNGAGLEIGPGYNPIFPKRAGYKVETVDHADAATLRAKYREAGVDLSVIEDVDYITGGRRLADAINKRACYDFIVASHVIEHAPDFIGFMADCTALLKDTGRLVLAVPDKRFCFDAFRPPSSTGQILQAHLDRRTRPPPQAIFDDLFYGATRGGKIGWLPTDDGELDFVRDTDLVANVYSDLCRRDYVDVHVWQFTPASFRLIVLDLLLAKLIALREVAFHDREGEFFAALSPTASEWSVPSRLSLAKQAVSEAFSLRPPSN